MGRPTTKPELIRAATEKFTKMLDIISSITEDERQTKFNFGDTIGKEAHWTRDENIKDVLVHLYEWHVLLIEWVEKNKSGEKKPFLPEPYNWKTYGEMNVGFWEKHKNTSYESATEMLKESHEKVLALIENFSDEELFKKKHFDWTGTSTLGSYCVSATSSHYEWATKKVKLHIKTLAK